MLSSQMESLVGSVSIIKYNKILIDLKNKVFLLISLIINSIYLLALEQSEQYTVGSNLV